jgi:diadenosine tetraphosphate (Ap4A) HIT family hydrolase
MSTRTRKETKKYLQHRNNLKTTPGCAFCKIEEGHPEFIRETASFRVIVNLFSYSVWDDQDVADHLMIVPKKHIVTLSHLNPEESQEFVKLMSSYESKGYNVWARAPKNIRKSVVHQHTHLIKPGEKVTKILFYTAKPYLRVAK